MVYQPPQRKMNPRTQPSKPADADLVSASPPRTHPLTPAQRLQLQRTHGNQYVQRLMRQSPPSTPQIQRKIYLENSDQLIYNDTAYLGEYAYAHTVYGGSGNTHYYTDYAQIRLLQNYVQARWNDLDPMIKAHFKNDINRYIPQLVQSFTTAKQLTSESSIWESWQQMDPTERNKYTGFDAYSQEFTEGVDIDQSLDVYQEDEDGNIETVNPPDVQLRLILQNLILYGARAAPTGHGSRLPHAEGKIVTKGDKSKADILTDLGVPVQKHNKYNNVEFEKDTFFYDALLGIALMLGENLIEGADYFYVSKVEVKRSRNALFTTSRGSFDETFSTVGGASTLETNIKNDFEALTSPKADTGWLDHTNLSTTNRGDGQMAAMNGWNALGAAAAANKWYGKAYPLNQNWEWLHIQGAQIGGKTQGDNLVAGLYVTNSAMIPYENTIKDWAQPNKRGLGGSLEARFEATPVGGNTKAFASQIKLSIAANNHSVLGTIARGSALTATFDPLTGRVVDNLFHQIKFKKDNWKH